MSLKYLFICNEHDFLRKQSLETEEVVLVENWREAQYYQICVDSDRSQPDLLSEKNPLRAKLISNIC